MRTRHHLSSILAISAVCGLLAGQSSSPNVNVQGSWELVDQQAGKTPKVVISTPSKRREVKLIVDGHFLWIIYDVKHKTPEEMGGGTYTLAGDAYVEHLDFASNRLSPYVGRDQEFRVMINGDRLLQNGLLSDGTRLQETWMRAH